MVGVSGGAGRPVYHYGTNTMARKSQLVPARTRDTSLTAAQARKIGDAVRAYRYDLSATTGQLITPSGTLIQGVQFQPMKGAKAGDHVEAVTRNDGRLLWSGRPEKAGDFVARFYNAEKVTA